MPAYEDEEHLSNCMRQYKDVGGRSRDLRDIWQGWISFDVEEDGSFGAEVGWSGGFGVEVSCKSFREDMDRSQDSITEGCSNIAVVNEEVLGILREVRSFKNTDGRSTVGFERSWCGLRESEPSQVSSIELYFLGCDGECIVFSMSRVQGDLGALDVTYDVKRGVVFADAERDRELAASGCGVDGEGSITGCN